MMHDSPALTEKEWALVLELVQRELAELPSEIHHTDRSAYRKELHDRRLLLQNLLDKLHLTPAA